MFGSFSFLAGEKGEQNELDELDELEEPDELSELDVCVCVFVLLVGWTG